MSATLQLENSYSWLIKSKNQKSTESYWRHFGCEGLTGGETKKESLFLLAPIGHLSLYLTQV
jgi:hypothetical protein